ncbi:hypothetical protein EMIT019CA3_290011 [Bacillus pseudomycoides]
MRSRGLYVQKSKWIDIVVKGYNTLFVMRGLYYGTRYLFYAACNRRSEES